MRDRVLRRVQLAIRVAARAMKQEKLVALMLKIRKGATSSLKTSEVLAILEYLGTGWSVEEALILNQQHTRDNEPTGRYGSMPGIQREWEDAKAREVKVLPEAQHLKKYETVYMDVSDLNIKDGETYGGFTFLAWQAVLGVKVTSPNHKVFYSEEDKDLFLKAYPSNNGLLKWLTSETEFLGEINRKLDLPSYEEERARARTGPRTRSNTGTCSVCMANIKLTPKARHGRDKTLPGMVLHGYKRPGLGYIEGNCFGQDWPPFELSSEGTEAYLDLLRRHQMGQQLYLKQLKAGDVAVIVGGQKVYKKDEMTPTDWQRELNDEIKTVGYTLSNIEKDIATREKLVREWKLQPLPAESL